MATEKYINQILDKISENGINILSKHELLTLKEFNGKFVSETKVITDKLGNLITIKINDLIYNKLEKCDLIHKNDNFSVLANKNNNGYFECKSTFDKRYLEYEVFFNKDYVLNNIKLKYDTKSKEPINFEIFDSLGNNVKFMDIYTKYSKDFAMSFNDALFFIEDNYLNIFNN